MRCVSSVCERSAMIWLQELDQDELWNAVHYCDAWYTLQCCRNSFLVTAEVVRSALGIYRKRVRLPLECEVRYEVC